MHKNKGNILVVDDIKDNLTILIQALGHEGYTVRPALNGQLAMDAARREAPDLILLDILMPGLNGYQVCDLLKKEPELRDVPVIFISALDDISDKLKGFSYGGLDYIRKPFHIEEVIARVETHLTLRDLRRELEVKNASLIQKNNALKKALDEIHILREISPICSNCKKIRDDDDSWQAIESYLLEHADIKFSHGLCPDCFKKLYPNM